MIDFDDNYIEPSDLILITDDENEYHVKLDDISAIKKIYSHPNDSNTTKGFPKYQVFLRNSQWGWVLIEVDEYERLVKPFVKNIRWAKKK